MSDTNDTTKREIHREVGQTTVDGTAIMIWRFVNGNQGGKNYHGTTRLQARGRGMTHTSGASDLLSVREASTCMIGQNEYEIRKREGLYETTLTSDCELPAVLFEARMHVVPTVCNDQQIYIQISTVQVSFDNMLLQWPSALKNITYEASVAMQRVRMIDVRYKNGPGHRVYALSNDGWLYFLHTDGRGPMDLVGKRRWAIDHAVVKTLECDLRPYTETDCNIKYTDGELRNGVGRPIKHFAFNLKNEPPTAEADPGEVPAPSIGEAVYMHDHGIVAWLVDETPWYVPINSKGTVDMDEAGEIEIASDSWEPALDRLGIKTRKGGDRCCRLPNSKKHTIRCEGTKA